MSCPRIDFEFRETAEEISATVKGALDKRLISTFMSLADRVRLKPGRTVTVDLSGVEEFHPDSISGLRALQQATTDSGGQFTARTPHDAIAEQLTAANIHVDSHPLR